MINQIRAFLLERGITVRPGRLALAKALPELLEAAGELSPTMRALLGRLRAHWQALDDPEARGLGELLTQPSPDPVPHRTREDRLGAWLRRLEARAHPNVVTGALAAKLARWAWAVLARNQAYRLPAA